MLDRARGEIVSRGYDYYITGFVGEVEEKYNYEYRALVEGSGSHVYDVTINITHPRKSTCTCPYANGNKICKHMIAVYFTVCPEEANDYEEWMFSDYSHEYEEEYEDDYYDDYDEFDGYFDHQDNFDKPAYFEEVLYEYVKSLSLKQAQELLKKELLKNPRDTYYEYLQEPCLNYLANNPLQGVVDDISKMVRELQSDYNYDYKYYREELLTKEQKELISSNYYKNSLFQKQIDNLLLTKELTVYYHYDWIIDFYQKQTDNNNLKEFKKVLEEYFDSLKHYGIKNTTPKSNVLMALTKLYNYSKEDTVRNLIKYSHYIEYVEYVIENFEDKEELYLLIKSLLKKNIRYRKESISLLFMKLNTLIVNQDIQKDALIYEFLYTRSNALLQELESLDNFDETIKDIKDKTSNTYTLEILYLYTNDPKSLYELAINRKSDDILMRNIAFLEEDYGEELYNKFITKFYDILKLEKTRKNYREACRYIEPISKLNKGIALVNKLIDDLHQSEYASRRALFDELNYVIRR